MYEYGLELFFYAKEVSEDIKQKGLQRTPCLEHYRKSTKTITLQTWEDFRNATLVDYPNVAYIHVLYKKLLVPMEEYIRQFETSDLKIKSSKLHGFGVFADRNIKHGEEVLKLKGKLVDRDRYKGGYPKGEWNAISDKYYLVSYVRVRDKKR